MIFNELLKATNEASKNDKTFKAKTVVRDQKKHNQEHAVVSWHIGDILDRRPDWSDAQCEDFLVNHGSDIQDAMTDAGWEAIDSLLPDD